MSLVSVNIPNFLGGISEQPSPYSSGGQCEDLINGWCHPVTGLQKRPPAELVKLVSGFGKNTQFKFIYREGKLEDIIFLSASKMVAYNIYTKISHPIYLCSSAIDFTGDNQLPTDFSNTGATPQTAFETTAYSSPHNGTLPDYLKIGGGVPDVKFLDISNTILVLNKKATIGTSFSYRSPQAASYNNRGLIFIKSGQYDQYYYAVIHTPMGNINAVYQSGSSGADEVRTERIATRLKSDIQTKAAALGINISFIQDSGTLYFQIANTTITKFTVSDSIGNTGIYGAFQRVDSMSDLPKKAKHGFTVKISATNASEDDYYVTFKKDSGNPDWSISDGVWEESKDPLIGESYLHKVTLPHALVYTGKRYVFCPISWGELNIGDIDSNPLPEFAGNKVNDIIIHENRLCLLSNNNIALSELGEYFNFFYTSIIAQKDTDPIHVSVNDNTYSGLRWAIPYSKALLLFTDVSQYRLYSSDGALNTSTVVIEPVSKYHTSQTIPPDTSAGEVYFSTGSESHPHIYEYRIYNNNNVDHLDICEHAPYLLDGSLSCLTSSDIYKMIATCSVDSKYLYTYNQRKDGNGGLVQSAWSKWEFDGKVLQAEFYADHLYILVHINNNIKILRIDLSFDMKDNLYLDEYSVINNTRVGGKLYKFSITLKHQPFTYREMVVDVKRFQLLNYFLHIYTTGNFEVILKRAGREDSVRTFDHNTLGVNTMLNTGGKIVENKHTGVISFRVASKTEHVSIVIESYNQEPLYLLSGYIEGRILRRVLN